MVFVFAVVKIKCVCVCVCVTKLWYHVDEDVEYKNVHAGSLGI